jgi:release factor glutamine methyltransferase
VKPLAPLRGATSRAEAFALLRRAFAEAGLDTPGLDARILLTEALSIGASGLALRPHEPLGTFEVERLRAFATRRLAHEPVARILGHQEFWGLPFRLSPETLVPRPDSETVVEAALDAVGGRDAVPRILDLGTGSGCLLVALLHELPTAWGIGVDRSPAAVATARENARRNEVAGRAGFAVSDWGAALAEKFDLVVSNPPYIATQTIVGLAPEVRCHDPPGALDGGSDGLDAYRAIFQEADRLTAPRGWLVVEIGFDQELSVRGLAAAAGLEVQEVAKDLGGCPRAVVMARLGAWPEHPARRGPRR